MKIFREERRGGREIYWVIIVQEVVHIYYKKNIFGEERKIYRIIKREIYLGNSIVTSPTIEVSARLVVLVSPAK